MNRLTSNCFAVSILLGALSCSSSNSDLELQAARTALDDARAAAANNCAKGTFEAAEAKLREAEELAAEEDFEKAKAAALEAEALANSAKASSPPGCDKAAVAEPEPKTDGEDSNRQLGDISLEQTVYFDYNQATIRDDSRSILTQIARQLAGDNRVKIEIEGHCDSRGSTEYNLHLGERRAKAVEKYLVAQGVSPDQVATISFGEERPVDYGENEAAYQRNRRAEIKRR